MQAESPARPVLLLMKDRDWEDLSNAERDALAPVARRGNNVLARLK